MQVHYNIGDAVLRKPAKNAANEGFTTDRNSRLGPDEGQWAQARPETRRQHERARRHRTTVHVRSNNMWVRGSPVRPQYSTKSARYESRMYSEGARPSARAVLVTPDSSPSISTYTPTGVSSSATITSWNTNSSRYFSYRNQTSKPVLSRMASRTAGSRTLVSASSRSFMWEA